MPRGGSINVLNLFCIEKEVSNGGVDKFLISDDAEPVLNRLGYTLDDVNYIEDKDAFDIKPIWNK